MLPEFWVAEQKLLKDLVCQKGVKGGRHPEAHAEENHCIQAPVDVLKHKNDAKGVYDLREAMNDRRNRKNTIKGMPAAFL